MIYKAAVADFLLMNENTVQDFGPWSQTASRFFIMATQYLLTCPGCGSVLFKNMLRI